MNLNPDPSPGIVGRRRRLCLVLMLCTSYFLSTSAETPAKEEPRQFYKPPSPCLMGASCKHCVDTLQFHHYQVCCYHCRLDNVIINNDVCHCIDTRLPESSTDMGGNCSSGQICDNCAVKISADPSEGVESTPGVPSFCCQDCGLVRPYLHHDDQGCHCEGDSQGQEHQAAPRYDPSQHNTTTQLPHANDVDTVHCPSVPLAATFLWTAYFITLN